MIWSYQNLMDTGSSVFGGSLKFIWAKARLIRNADLHTDRKSNRGFRNRVLLKKGGGVTSSLPGLLAALLPTFLTAQLCTHRSARLPSVHNSFMQFLRGYHLTSAQCPFHIHMPPMPDRLRHGEIP